MRWKTVKSKYIRNKEKCHFLKEYIENEDRKNVIFNFFHFSMTI